MENSRSWEKFGLSLTNLHVFLRWYDKRAVSFNDGTKIPKVKCSSSATSLKITYNVKQTGNLDTPVETFKSQIAADVKSKTLKLTVNTVKRKFLSNNDSTDPWPLQ